MDKTILSPGHARRCLRVVAVLLFSAMGTPMSASAGQLLDFTTIQGKWTGFGWFEFGVAERQRARCEAIIRADGSPDRGNLDLKCKSEGLIIDGKVFDIIFSGAKASGKWKLLSHDIDGTLLGNVTENSFSMFLKPHTDRDRGYGVEFSTIFQNKCHASIKVSVRSPIDLKKIDLSVRRC